MKYFTPERWLRLQNVDDNRALSAAVEDWERAITAYREELATLLPRLPARLRRFAESECLHDATVVSAWLRKSRLEILLRPEPAGERLYLLAYSLVESPRVRPSGISSEYHTAQECWMYDEVGVEGSELPGEADGKPVFTHSILLNGGWEVTLRFRRFDMLRPEALLPAPGTVEASSPAAISQSA